MKDIQEIAKLGKVFFDHNTLLKNRMFYSGKMTECMQMRIVHRVAGVDGGDYTVSLFQCGVDVQKLENGKLIVTSTIGIHGYDLREFIYNVVRFYGDSLSKGYCIVICDDPNDKPNKPIEEIKLDVLLNGLEEIKL